ncbi:MAG: MFS transporter, partial [Gammaproteobacteria bacterium]
FAHQKFHLKSDRLLVPELVHERTADEVRAPVRGVLTLLRLPLFRNLVLVAALILGSHAMHDAFAVIRWSTAGISSVTASVLWSESVAAAVLVFFIIGPALIRRLTPAGAIATAALAGMLRWTVMAQTSDVIALALVQPLHGITFALLHLACMRLIARTVPRGLEGTAQAIYGTVGIGAATAVLTLVSGGLYARLGAQGFWVMAVLCALAFPLTWKLRQPV